MRLLIVEDDPSLQKQLRWSFDAYDVVVAGDRESALAQIERQFGKTHRDNSERGGSKRKSVDQQTAGKALALGVVQADDAGQIA